MIFIHQTNMHRQREEAPLSAAINLQLGGQQSTLSDWNKEQWRVKRASEEHLLAWESSSSQQVPVACLGHRHGSSIPWNTDSLGPASLTTGRSPCFLCKPFLTLSLSNKVSSASSLWVSSWSRGLMCSM